MEKGFWKTVKQRSCCSPRHETDQLGSFPLWAKGAHKWETELGESAGSAVQGRWACPCSCGMWLLCQPCCMWPLDFHCRDLMKIDAESFLSLILHHQVLLYLNHVSSSYGIMSISQTRALKATIAEQLQQLNLELSMQASWLWFSKNLDTIKKQPILRAPNVPSKCSSCRMLVAYE